MRKSAFVRKYSVQFVSQSGKASQPFYFSTRYDSDIAQTWQVLRSEFDLMLMQHARAKGATVLEEVAVTNLLKEGERVIGVRAQDKNGNTIDYRAPLRVTGLVSLFGLQIGYVDDIHTVSNTAINSRHSWDGADRVLHPKFGMSSGYATHCRGIKALAVVGVQLAERGTA